MEKPELRRVLKIHPSWWVLNVETNRQSECNCRDTTWLCFTLETQDLTHYPFGEVPVN